MTATRTPPDAIERGDVVTLKTDPGRKYVVLGYFVSVPTYYLVRAAGEREIVVRRCEIASVEKHADTPDVLRNGTAHPVEQDQYHDDDRPLIEWEPETATGTTFSRCGRFEVEQCQGHWRCLDHDSGEQSALCALPAIAHAWAERRLAETPPALQWVEWAGADESGFVESTGRFKIIQRVDSSWRPIAGLFTAIDQKAESVELRYSEDGALDACKRWCRWRSRWDVGVVAGVERLVEPIPF